MWRNEESCCKYQEFYVGTGSDRDFNEQKIQQKNGLQQKLCAIIAFYKPAHISQNFLMDKGNKQEVVDIYYYMVHGTLVPHL